MDSELTCKHSWRLLKFLRSIKTVSHVGLLRGIGCLLCISMCWIIVVLIIDERTTTTNNQLPHRIIATCIDGINDIDCHNNDFPHLHKNTKRNVKRKRKRKGHIREYNKPIPIPNVVPIVKEFIGKHSNISSSTTNSIPVITNTSNRHPALLGIGSVHTATSSVYDLLCPRDQFVDIRCPTECWECGQYTNKEYYLYSLYY